jgi:transcriptional regulator with XRE-family HTH domain/F0F1-type ATP synthase assembly protein I
MIMILADKIIRLRKKNGWSQEELAEKMNVSRQAVSKWEGAQTIPDLEKILMLSNLFGVTTDYLLKDEMEDEEFVDSNIESIKRITLAQANEFIEWRKLASVRIAVATLLCVIAVIPLMLLGALTECSTFPISENVAVGAGLIILLVLITIAVGIFIVCGFKNAPFEFIDKEPFETEYGVTGMVKERQKAYRSTYVRYNLVGTCICVLSPIPLFIGVFTDKEFFTVAMLLVTILLAGIGAVFFIIAGVRWASMQKLLKEGDYALRDKKKTRIKDAIASVYWLMVTAVYLAWSFWTNAWESTWLVWPVAGVLFAGIMCICSVFLDQEK